MSTTGWLIEIFLYLVVLADFLIFGGWFIGAVLIMFWPWVYFSMWLGSR